MEDRMKPKFPAYGNLTEKEKKKKHFSPIVLMTSFIKATLILLAPCFYLALNICDIKSHISKKQQMGITYSRSYRFLFYCHTKVPR